MTRGEQRLTICDLGRWADRNGVRLNGCRRGIVVYHRPRWGFPGPAVHIPRIEEAAEDTVNRVSLAIRCLVDKPKPRSDSPGSQVPLNDSHSAQRWPKLWEQMTCDVYKDGDPRQPSSLLVFMQDGSLKGMLREKNTQQCLWLSARGLIPLLDVFEVELGSDSPDWREDKAPATPRRGGGRKVS